MQKQGLAGDRILIQLPGIEDPERIKEVLADPALLEWKAVSYPPTASDPSTWIPPETKEELVALFGGKIPSDTEVYPQRIPGADGSDVVIWWPLKRVSTVVGNDLRTAYRSTDKWGEAAVAFELSQDAG